MAEWGGIAANAKAGSINVMAKRLLIESLPVMPFDFSITKPEMFDVASFFKSRALGTEHNGYNMAHFPIFERRNQTFLLQTVVVNAGEFT